jgi:hypothetical protein
MYTRLLSALPLDYSSGSACHSDLPMHPPRSNVSFKMYSKISSAILHVYTLMTFSFTPILLKNMLTTFAGSLRFSKNTSYWQCKWFTPSVEYLGHNISGEGISVDAEKVCVLAKWPTPTTKTDIQSFLGLANYYRRFIHKFADTTACLNDLVHDASPDILPWSSQHQHAFDTLKYALTHAPVLRTYDQNLPCTVVTDASSSLHAIGAVLMQDDGTSARPLAYFSRKMTTAERKYPTREQELLAVRDALRHWKHYLLCIWFKIQSDHESLKHLFSQKELNGRLLRWCDFLQQFNFGDIEYLLGSKNPVSDALSRPPDDSGPAGTLAVLEVVISPAHAPETLYNYTNVSLTQLFARLCTCR